MAREEPQAEQDAVDKEPAPAVGKEAAPDWERPQVPLVIEGDPGVACPQDPSSKNISADSWAIDVRLGQREDGVLEWEPVWVHTEVGPDKQQAWRKQIAEVYPALLVAKAFQWSGMESF